MARGPKDFEEALRILEGSFVKIVDQNVSFLNPSLKDYLSSYLLDVEILVKIAPTATSIDWILRLWSFVYPLGLAEAEQQQIVHACIPHLEMIEKRPHWRPKPGDSRYLEYNDAENSKRLEMLMNWWQITDDARIAESIMNIARNPQQGFGSWSDGKTLLNFFARLRDRGYGRAFIHEGEFLQLIEKGLTDTIRYSASDALASFVDAIDDLNGDLPASISSALQRAVLEEFDENSSRIQEEDNESSLNDRIDELKKFAPRYGVPEEVLATAIAAIESRINEIEESSSSSSSPSYTPSQKKESENFDDNALRNLFTPLLDR